VAGGEMGELADRSSERSDRSQEKCPTWPAEDEAE